MLWEWCIYLKIKEYSNRLRIDFQTNTFFILLIFLCDTPLYFLCENFFII